MFSEISLWILITMSWQLFGGGSEGSIFLYSVKDTEYLLLWSCIRLMVMTGNVQSISFNDRTYSSFKKVSSIDISHLTLLRNMSGWLKTGQWPLERENEVAATLSFIWQSLQMKPNDYKTFFTLRKKMVLLLKNHSLKASLGNIKWWFEVSLPKKM